MHVAAGREFPVLVTIGPKPLLGVIVPLVGEAYGNTILPEGPEFLDQPVVEFAAPFSREKRDDSIAALDEF